MRFISSINQRMPLPLLIAFAHIREHFPYVTLVVFGRDTRWQYMSEEFDAPKFGNNIHVEVLEDAQRAVESKVNFPCVFQIVEKAE